MKLLVNRAEILPVHMGVDLRGGEIRMAEHLLHRAEVGATFEEVGGKAVAQGVRRDSLSNSGALRCTLHDTPGTHPREWLAPGIQQQSSPALAAIQLGANGVQVHRNRT